MCSNGFNFTEINKKRKELLTAIALRQLNLAFSNPLF